MSNLLGSFDNPPDPQRHGHQEPDFRRGYQHGALDIVEAMKRGFSVEELERFVEDDLRKWRESWERASFPPYLKR